MKRREWWTNGSVLFSTESSAKTWSGSNAEVIPVREVLPDDPDPEWVDELIRISRKICEAESMDEADDFLNELTVHLAKRVEK